MRSIKIALRKRPVEDEKIEQMVNGIVRRLEAMGENDIPSHVVGQLIMDGLRNLDDIAFIRFASVYKNFREASDFESAVDALTDPGEALTSWIMFLCKARSL